MVVAGLPQLSLTERQQVLETADVAPRLELVLGLLRKVVEVQTRSREISSKMQKRTEDELRETVLKRQLQELNKEMRRLKGIDTDDVLGGVDAVDDDEDEISVIRASLKAAELSPEAQRIAQRELRRLQNIQPQHPEYTVCRTYLETLAALPWAKSSKDDLDLSAAREILDKDHHGLEKVKRRILEFLAVQKMRGDMKGPILCLHGPPGVGKTSLGRSVAKALGRKFHRIALGGVRDEAELRGHRRTYIGSMPGSIIQALNTLKVNNPVILLDEIDKLTRNAIFNPSGALLELLDPEQNYTFKDHYLNVPFDLSKVLFLCTCNELQLVDRPLMDRMEVIDLSGYTVEEKVHIATTHLLPKQREMHALVEITRKSEGEQAATPLLTMTPSAISELVSKWTMESGVRSLERRIAQVCRWAALRLANEDDIAPVEETDAARAAVQALRDTQLGGPGSPIAIDAQHLRHIIGAEIFEPDHAERLTVGVAMGLGVTATGGQLLFVEATKSRGKGGLTVTGQLGDVMRESVTAALSLLRSKYYAVALSAVGDEVGTAALAADGVPGAAGEASARFQEVLRQLAAQSDGAKDPFGSDDVHVHFPAGATPKDGPSAGVATALALASLLLNQPVRSDTAVTGEISLRGHVLPVGGIRDKVLAAHRAGIRQVLLPFGNMRHVKDEIPASALGEIQIHYLKHIDEALAWAFAQGAPGYVPPSGGTGESLSTFASGRSRL
jgi:ATP-dependent Lon protease